jgi:hypothetical protein
MCQTLRVDLWQKLRYSAFFRSVQTGAIGAIGFLCVLGGSSKAALASSAVPPGMAQTRVLACSFAHPLCIVSADSQSLATAQSRLWLKAFDQAWDNLRLLELEPPERDLDSGRIEIRIGEGERDAEATIRERIALSAFDRASARLTVRGVPASMPCEIERVANKALLLASFVRTNPAASRAVADGIAQYGSELLSRCALPASEALAQVMTHPEASFLSMQESASSVFFRFLDEHYGREPMHVLADLLAFSPTKTEITALTLETKPDIFRVMKESFRDLKFKGSKAEDTLVDFAVDRAFFGAGLATPRIWTDWEVPWPKKPHRILATRAIEPLGASYIKISREGAQPGSRLRFETSWEFESRIRWTFVKVRKDGSEIARINVGTPERATEVQMSLANLDETDHLWLIGLNMGDPARTLYDQELTTEPHKWLVTIAEE